MLLLLRSYIVQTQENPEFNAGTITFGILRWHYGRQAWPISHQAIIQLANVFHTLEDEFSIQVERQTKCVYLLQKEMQQWNCKARQINQWMTVSLTLKKLPTNYMFHFEIFRIILNLFSVKKWSQAKSFMKDTKRLKNSVKHVNKSNLSLICNFRDIFMKAVFVSVVSTK